MNIDNILKRLEPEQDERKSRILYESIQKTLHPANFTDDSRLQSYMDLLNLCTKERNEDMLAFTGAVIAADYYFSVGRGLQAVPFLNESLQKYGKLSGMEAISVDDAESFTGHFRVLNINGKNQRENKAVRNVLVLNQAARKKNLELSLEELVLDYVPGCYIWQGFIASLALILAGLYIAMYQFEEFRIARLSGRYMPFLDALQPSEIPVVLIGLSIAVMPGWYTFAKCTPLHVRLMSRYYYWRFSH